MSDRDLSPFFAPKSVAVVGAGERATSSGGAIMQMLRQAGYGGRVVPVNPKDATIFDYESVTSIAIERLCRVSAPAAAAGSLGRQPDRPSGRRPRESLWPAFEAAMTHAASAYDMIMMIQVVPLMVDAAPVKWSRRPACSRAIRA
jgi:hypothetical protein